jgi:hypothetical protein
MDRLVVLFFLFCFENVRHQDYSQLSVDWAWPLLKELMSLPAAKEIDTLVRSGSGTVCLRANCVKEISRGFHVRQYDRWSVILVNRRAGLPRGRSGRPQPHTAHGSVCALWPPWMMHVLTCRVCRRLDCHATVPAGHRILSSSSPLHRRTERMRTELWK